MRAFLLLVFLLSLNLSYEQQKQCGCKTDTLINQFTVDCKTILLNNGSKLFWQFNCDSIWLTLQNQLGKKIIIDTVPIEYYPGFCAFGEDWIVITITCRQAGTKSISLKL